MLLSLGTLYCTIRSCLALAIMLMVPFATGVRAVEVKAVPTSTFLDSIGVDTTMPDRGQPLERDDQDDRVRRLSVGARRHRGLA